MALNLLDFIPPVSSGQSRGECLPETGSPRVVGASISGAATNSGFDDCINDPFGFRASWESRSLRLSDDAFIWPHTSGAHRAGLLSSSGSNDARGETLSLGTSSLDKQASEYLAQARATVHTASGAGLDNRCAAVEAAEIAVLHDLQHTGPTSASLEADSKAVQENRFGSDDRAFETSRSSGSFESTSDLRDSGQLDYTNLQLRAALFARTQHLKDAEKEAEAEEALARARLESMAEELRQERGRVEMLRGLLARAKRDADAMEAARFLATQKAEERSMTRKALQEQWPVFLALRTQLEAAARSTTVGAGASPTKQQQTTSCGDTDDSSSDLALERKRAAQGLLELRLELREARSALAAEQARSDQLDARQRKLQDQLRPMRDVGLAGDDIGMDKLPTAVDNAAKIANPRHGATAGRDDMR